MCVYAKKQQSNLESKTIVQQCRLQRDKMIKVIGNYFKYGLGGYDSI